MTPSKRLGGIVRPLTRKALFLATASLIALIAAASEAGFETGWTAYQNGDFATAIAEWKPLAADGDQCPGGRDL